MTPKTTITTPSPTLMPQPPQPAPAPLPLPPSQPPLTTAKILPNPLTKIALLNLLPKSTEPLLITAYAAAVIATCIAILLAVFLLDYTTATFLNFLRRVYCCTGRTGKKGEPNIFRPSKRPTASAVCGDRANGGELHFVRIDTGARWANTVKLHQLLDRTCPLHSHTPSQLPLQQSDKLPPVAKPHTTNYTNQHENISCTINSNNNNNNNTIDTQQYTQPALPIAPLSACTLCPKGIAIGHLARRLPCGHAFHAGCLDTRFLSLTPSTSAASARPHAWHGVAGKAGRDCGMFEGLGCDGVDGGDGGGWHAGECGWAGSGGARAAFRCPKCRTAVFHTPDLID